MKHHTTLTKFLSNLIILVTILFLSTTCIIAQEEIEDESEFDYIKGSEKGPSHWGEIKKEWAACKNGRLQSPIDLSSHRVKIVPKLGELKKYYKPQNATIKNRGHDIEVKWEGDAGSININGTQFLLHQAHWHSPSEHTINGRRFVFL
ncbi:Alpha carbonic anhydrase 7 [Trifolium repens]|nr:Alpha carbonic anhydrase 7 [Trifolium repens]